MASRGTIIYFVIADLGGLDPMYQYSLAYYKALFGRCIEDSERSEDLEQRLTNIIDFSTLTIYENICRGLFEKDKLLFSASICFQIQRNANMISDSEWNLFLRGPGALDKTDQPPNPQVETIQPFQWDVLYAAEQRVKFRVKEEGEGKEAKEGEEPKEKKKAADGTEALEVNDYSDPNPFTGLCDSLKDNYTEESDGWITWIKSHNLIEAPLPIAGTSIGINTPC